MARKTDYFEGFIKLAEYSYNAAKLLDDTLRDFNKDSLQKTMKLMHEIEHTADLEGHEITKKLLKAVSYTHLDVYKRQVITILSKHKVRVPGI